MSDHDRLPAPPAVEPLDDATRALLRGRVLAGLDDADRGSPRRWLVPAGAAAAVLVVAGVTAGLALGDDDGARGSTVDPAASSTPSADDVSPTPNPTPGVDPAQCDREVRGVVRGAEPVAGTSSDTGTTTFYEAGDRWTLCSTHGGRATVHQPRRVTAPDDRTAYGVSSVYSAPRTSTFVAGGVLPVGVSGADITYTFADGHEEPATTVADDDGRTWWAMEYTVAGGVMNRGNQLDLDPIRVDVAYDGVQESYELDWALDTCRQANHGC